MQNFNLSDLLSPISPEDFLQSNWPKDPLFIEPQTGKLHALLQLTQLKDLKTLIHTRTMKIRACLPDFEDEYSSIHLEPTDALKAYRNNMTLIFDSMQTQDEGIKEILKNITKGLGLVTGLENDLCKARSIAYATPAGSGTRLHFDANANFIIQLSGSKRWTLAPNTSVDFPTERFTTNAPEMSAALEKQCHSVLLNKIPEDATEILMQEGSVLFVPRGYWHATTTEEDSLSLNFTFSQPTWADVFTKSLQELLLTSTAWRELADGLAGSSDRKQVAIDHLQKLISVFAKDASKLSAESLLKESGIIK